MNSKIVLFIVSAMVAGITAAFASDAGKTEKFKVYGNCGMCEKRIEQAAKSIKGVSLADWDKKTGEITVSFDPAKTDVHKVHSAIAGAGHDTQMHRASDEAYDKLHNCCKYKRAEKQQEGSGMKHTMPSSTGNKAVAGCCNSGS